MTNDEIRIAIAEACGWTGVERLIIRNVSFQGDDRMVGITSDQGWIPNYTGDLNAVQTALQYLGSKVMASDLWEKLGREIEAMHGTACLASALNDEQVDYHDFVTLLAELTPRNYCEAILRTLDQWKE